MGSQSIVTPNEFQGADTERINQAIRAAAGTGQRVVIPRRNEAQDGPRDIWLLDAAILVDSGTVLELDNCHQTLGPLPGQYDPQRQLRPGHPRD